MSKVTLNIPVDVEMVDVESSNIKAVGYLEGYGTFVQFHSGEFYRYPTAFLGLYQALLDAESKGKFFNAHIKPQAYQKLPRPV